MKIGILSDSHDNYSNVQKAIDVFNDREAEVVLHSGDFVSSSTVSQFSQLQTARFVGVFGNCDHGKQGMKRAAAAFGGEIHSGIFTGELDGAKVFMTHCCSVVDEVASNGLYDLVVYGHTHKRDIRRVSNALVVNPGETAELSFGQTSIVMLDTASMDYDVIKL
ncbi:MAG: metallophosphoesterase [Planctomycetes bacterium]|nr:metallophosphoesterase [Planctomycetota bacterium]